jgi:hypothetical protein
LVKSYDPTDWDRLFTRIGTDYLAVSTGIGHNDLNKLVSILELIPAIRFICIDVANGYS